MSFSGNGTVKGIDFRDVGTALITFRPNGYGDLKGEAVITTATGKNGTGNSNSNEREKATYTFYAIGH